MIPRRLPRCCQESGCGPLLVGLDGESESIPAGERRVRKHGLDDVEGNIKSVGLFGVDAESDPGVAGGNGKRPEARHELGSEPRLLGEIEARMER